jgi:hypothetical protein
MATDGRSISKSWCRAPSVVLVQIFIIVWQLRSWFLGHPLGRENGSVFFICCWPSPAQYFSGRSPLSLATIFYCLSFDTFLFVASYDSQGHGGGIRPRLHTGSQVKVKVKVTLRLTVSQSVSLSVEPHLGLMTRNLLLFDSYGLIFLGRPLWREDRSVFLYASGPRQRSLSRVWVP